MSAKIWTFENPLIIATTVPSDVSKSAVSRVFRKSSSISDKMRAKVKVAAITLGYRRNAPVGMPVEIIKDPDLSPELRVFSVVPIEGKTLGPGCSRG